MSGVRNSCATSRAKRRSRATAVYSRCRPRLNASANGRNSRGKSPPMGRIGWSARRPSSDTPARSSMVTMRRTRNSASPVAIKVANAIPPSSAKCTRRSVRSQSSRSLATTRIRDGCVPCTEMRVATARPACPSGSVML
ncbi:hypothetical protein SDC9_208289 [bioreactor metagenome]|uniref:Uncharacterized protein n=1 Tax=bioreactor metagenome TaxID=1076179 RepID=A0A645JBV7_9ZZZZ